MIVKYGGNAMKNPQLRRTVARELAELRTDTELVVVHGGGPFIERELDLRGLKSEFIRGLRVTTPEAMQVVEMALGKVNKELSRDIGQAVGLMGHDCQLIVAEALGGELGRVGRVVGINADLLRTLLGVQLTPVVGCVGLDRQGEALNINADTVAGAVAGALGQGVIFLTDVEGVYRAFPDPASLAPELSRQDAEEGIEAGWISGGMVPKVRAALDALERGATFATIASGMQAGVVRRAAAGQSGTRVVP
ncbi:acetylglutamate kinase [Deinococcus irradiatisoli]|uniref:Acetylglutamate kinase n=1 Tax=Deinococcus irradiatisoli TaxID=2202254 RepID=A0A2Z3J9R8_9DEIO|nr:acetylglutamate kinase [Deinococcus irradiatisoli]AWN21823.1 acetylglutamate kinase [Deinococcus irradiatisoli]